MNKKETYIFQSEIKQLLNIMINSLYSNKEIFLRELISNASDAIDKLRFYALSKPELYEEENNQLKIRISIDKKNSTILISDNGIGMKHDEVIENLGKIAHSGTKSFIENFGVMNDKNNMIGKFGVGFYSSFIVANKVLVHTKYAGLSPNNGILWESTGEGNYSISNMDKKSKGTDIILHLREKEKEFLDIWRLKNIISKYSDHISIPIEIKNNDEQNKLKKWEQVNKAEAIWTRNKSTIKENEYKDFYKYISNDQHDPLIWSHNIVEGKHNYICLLYIPYKAPFDLWHSNYKYGLKIYTKRVFIMDNSENFIPNYLRFIRGIIDSNNLPLNISREVLQNNHIIKNLNNSLTKKILSILEKTAKNDEKKYQQFWKEFGLVFKEGPAEDIKNINKISKLLRFASTKNNSDEQSVSLDDYINRMLKEQEKIYYITADNYISAKNSPHLEIFRKKNIEVLLLFDRIDEWMMNYLIQFNGKTFQLISKNDKDISNLIEKEKEQDKSNNICNDENIKNFLEKIKLILGDRIKNVRLSNRLVSSPSILITDGELSTQMHKMLVAAGQNVPKINYLFEINCNHPIIINILNKIKEVDKNNDEYLNDWIEYLFGQSLLAERGTLEDNNKFIALTNKLLISNK